MQCSATTAHRSLNQTLNLRQRDILKLSCVGLHVASWGKRGHMSLTGEVALLWESSHRLHCWCAGVLSCVSDAVLVTGRLPSCLELGKIRCWLLDSTSLPCVSPLVCGISGVNTLGLPCPGWLNLWMWGHVLRGLSYIQIFHFAEGWRPKTPCEVVQGPPVFLEFHLISPDLSERGY